ncbi:histidine kinase, partial [Halobacteriales archaeon QH_6_66_25]
EVAIYDAMIEAAVETLGFDWCAVGVPVEGQFEIRAVSETAPAEKGERKIGVDEGISGRSLQDGESIIVADAIANDEADPTEESIVSAISVPLGEWGVFQGYSAEVGAFDENDLEVAELLAAHARAALDRIEREYELKRKNERLEQFTSFVSHDLKNPLNVADLRLELAMEDCDSEHLRDVAVALDRMETLTDDLLTLAKAGQRVDDVEPIHLATLARTCWQTVRTAGATLELETDQTVLADRTRLQQLLENLIRNAVEHGSTSPRSHAPEDAVEHGSTSRQPEAEDAVEHGTSDAEEGESDVTVTIGALAGGFYVSDNGRGIPEADRDSIFEHGYSTADGGTGFGLAIVADIVEAHDWSIMVTDSDAGGARFEITGVETP